MRLCIRFVVLMSMLGPSPVFATDETKLRGTLTGHTLYVTAVAFSPDGKTLVSGSADKSIKLWNVSTGKNFAALKGHAHNLTSLVFSPDGKILASGSLDKTIKLWDIETGKNIATFVGHEFAAFPMQFSPDGKRLASAGKCIKLWDVSTSKNTTTFAGDVRGAFSPDWKMLATAAGNNIEVRDVKTGAKLAAFAGHQDGLRSIAFSPDGKTLASGGSGPPQDNLKLWDVARGRLIHTLVGHIGSFGADSVAPVVFSPDGKILITCGNRTIRFWEVSTGKTLAILEAPQVRSLALSADGGILAAGGFGKDYSLIKLWDVTGVIPKRQREVKATEPLLLIKGDDFAIHLFLGGVVTPPPDSDQVPNGMGVGGYTLSHTDLKSAKMKWLYTSGVRAVPTRRVSFAYSRIVGFAHDAERLYLSVWEMDGDLTVEDNTLSTALVEAEKAARQGVGGMYRLRVLSARDGELIRRFDFQPLVPPKGERLSASEQAVPTSDLPRRVRGHVTSLGPLRLRRNGVACFGVRFVFENDKFLTWEREPMDFGAIPAPTDADREAAKTLGPEVLEAAVAYLKAIGLKDDVLADAKIVAARRTDGLLLLDVYTRGRDSNRHLVYSFDERRIRGWFRWYPQG